MLSHGNSDPRVCALNLLRTIRGEVPFARIKGIGREHIDAPSTWSAELQADAEWVLETFEPRLTPGEVRLIAAEECGGDYALVASVERG